MQAKLYAYLKNNPPPDVLVCEDAAEAAALADLCRFLELPAIALPDFRAVYLDDLRPFHEELTAMAEALRRYDEADEKPVLIAPFKTLLFPMPKASLLRKEFIAFGDTLPQADFKEKLLHWGYSFVDLVEMEGEVSFRGDIIDIFVPGAKQPYRISLFDDEIEEIRPFDVETQRTAGEELEGFELHGAPYTLDAQGYERLRAAAEASQSDSFVKDIASLGFWYLGEDAENLLEGKTVRTLKPLGELVEEAYALNVPQIPRETFESIEVIAEDDGVKALAVTDVKTLLEVHPGKKATLIAASDAQLKQAGIFDTTGITVRRSGEIVNLITDTELII